MKNKILILLFFIANSVFSQDTAQFYQTTNKLYAFKFEGNSCTLYALEKYDNDVSFEEELKATRKFEKPSDSIGIIYSNNFYAISYDYKFFRVVKMKNGKPKNKPGSLAKKLADPSKLYEAINHTHWKKEYEEVLDGISSDFPLFSEYRYWSGYEIWNSIQFKQIPPEEFEVRAKEQNRILKDSLANTNRKLIALNASVEKQMSDLTAEEFKTTFLSYPLSDFVYNAYVEEMLDSVAKKRPDLFFALAEALPDRKEYIFNRVSLAKEVKRSLQNYETDAPIKKEFFKFRRKQRFIAVSIITGVSILEAGIIGGLIYLIVK